jgi:hypothetical protein
MTSQFNRTRFLAKLLVLMAESKQLYFKVLLRNSSSPVSQFDLFEQLPLTKFYIATSILNLYQSSLHLFTQVKKQLSFKGSLRKVKHDCTVLP